MTNGISTCREKQITSRAYKVSFIESRVVRHETLTIYSFYVQKYEELSFINKTKKVN